MSSRNDTSESINCNHAETKWLASRELKCTLCVSAKCSNVTSHVLQFKFLRGALHHGRCYQIDKLIN